MIDCCSWVSSLSNPAPCIACNGGKLRSWLSVPPNSPAVNLDSSQAYGLRFHQLIVPNHHGGSTGFRYQHQVEFSRIIPAPSLFSPPKYCDVPCIPLPLILAPLPFPPIRPSIYSPCRHSLGVRFPSFLFESLSHPPLWLWFFSPFIIITSSTNILFCPAPLSFFSFSFFPHIGFHLFN